MFRSTPQHPKGPSVQVTYPPAPGQSDQIIDSPSSISSSPASSFASGSVMPSPATVYSENPYPVAGQHHMGLGGSHQGPFVEFVRAHPKGVIRFRPFDDDGRDAVVRESFEKFQIYPAGHIQNFCRHIPYASGKKDFFEKTGRESFEVYQYVFKVPGDDKEYHVMWDYNIGLVRMTPFFKCCKYSKTTPAKMLNLNPGLRDITHSITGGSIMAQGYWMPYSCAKAVCATFCYHIAGALIPIFGPDFPSECLPPQSTDFGRMVIDRALVAEATRETEYMREIYLRNPEEGAAPPSLYQPTTYYTPEAERSRSQQGDPGFRPANVHHHALPAASVPYARPVTMSSLEDGPQLAPLNSAAPRYGALLPSLMEHKRLPPLSQIKAVSSTTLPPLISRESQDRGPYSGTQQSRHHPGFVQSQHRHYMSLPSVGANEEAQYVAKRSRLDPQPDSMSIPTSRPELRHWDAPVANAPMSRTPPTSSHRSERRKSAAGNEQQISDQAHTGSLSSYPSPPGRQYVELYYADAERGQPSHAHGSLFFKSEEDHVAGFQSKKKAMTISRAGGAEDALYQQAYQQAQPGTANRRRKLKIRGSGLGSSSSAAAWNELDVDAAEVLVNFSVKVKSSKGDDQEECDRECDDDNSISGRPAIAEGSKKAKPRFNASIASLLCDGEVPRQKRCRS